MASSGFSGVLKLTDLNDFITPSQECIKPVTLPERQREGKGVIKIEDDFSISDLNSSESLKYEKAKITLNDCLACSGCVTTAEVVLVNQQSIEELMRIIKENELRTKEDKLCLVLSISPQSIVSLSAKYSLSTQDCLYKITGYFKKLGVHFVFDTNFGRCFSLIEAQKEFVERYRRRQSDDCASFPMLASACPGWICYAEKTHSSYILPYLSTTRSPQQVMGAVVKDFWAHRMDLKPSKIYHVTLMPCFDKKLEASRDEFLSSDSQTKEVDCVITSVELEQLFEKDSINLNTIEGLPLDTELSLSSSLISHEGSGSGGYAHHIFRYAAKELFSIENSSLEWKVLRNNDFQEASLDVGGKTVLRFALAYGFRNIQNIVQKIKRNKCPYDYIEIMACPSGCLNGGAQVRQDINPKDLVKQLEESYSELPTTNPNEEIKIKELYTEWLDGEESFKAKEKLHTSFKKIEPMTNALGIKW